MESISEDLAYLFGIIGGDGTIYNKHRQHRIFISDKCKEFHFEVLNPMLEKEFGYKPKTRFIEKRNTWYTIVYSKRIVEILIKKYGHSAGREKTYKGKVPSPIIEGDNNLKISYISGWIDAEGHCKLKKFKKGIKIYKYPCIVIELVNKEMLSQLYSLSKDIGLSSTKPIFAKREYKNRVPRFYICWNGFEKCKYLLNHLKHPAKKNRLIKVLLAGDQSEGLT